MYYYSDSEMDNYYSQDFYGPGTDYFDPPEEDEEDPVDDEYDDLDIVFQSNEKPEDGEIELPEVDE